MRRLAFGLLAASACTSLGARPQYCKSFPLQTHVAVLSSVSPTGNGGSGVGLTNCQTLQPVYVPTSDGDSRGIYNRTIAQKVRNLDERDARALGMKRFLLVEVETDCGGVCRPTRFSYDYECGPGPAVTSLRVVDGTKAYPLHLDDVVDEAERRHRLLLASHEPELRALVSTNRNDVREETTLCVAPADPNLHIGVRTIARVPVDCRGHTDCFMVRGVEPAATLSSDFTVSREGRILREDTSGPVRATSSP
jgi:hypothetical protein